MSPADFDRQPLLAEGPLSLRPLTADDIEPLYAIAGDPLVWDQHPMPERSERAHFEEWIGGKLADGGTLVAHFEGEGLIASSTYSNLRTESGGAIEIGSTFLARRMWGGPVNRTIKRLMLRHAFTYVAQVEFLVWDRNVRSRRAMEKIGGRLTDRTATVAHRAQAVVHLVYEITREDFTIGPLANA